MSNFSSGLSEFERELLNHGYKQLEPFYLLKEGEIFDERNGGTQKITKRRLEQIAATQNARVTDSNDATPIIIGHTKRQLPETKQPPIVGLAPRWEVVKFFKTDKWALQAIPWAKPGTVKIGDDEEITNEEAFNRFPRRSAEFWTDPDVLDPVSILGANTPRLDLGLHRLQANRQSIRLGQDYTPRTPIILEMDMPDNPLTAPATPDNLSATSGLNSDWMNKVDACCSKMEDLYGLLEPFLDELRQTQGMGGGMGGMDGGMGGPPLQGGPPPGAGQAGPGTAPVPTDNIEPATTASGGGVGDEDDHEPVRAMAGTPAGGTNTMMPRQYDRRGGQQPTRTSDPRDNELQQLRLQNQQLTQSVAALQLQRIEDIVNNTLDDLEDKIVFDRPREFKRMVQLSRQELDEHVAYMQNTYKPKDEPLPEPAVPLQMQARRPNQPVAAPGGPITLQQAQEMMGTPADPTMVTGAPKSRYDQLVDIVRNRGKNGKPLMATYEEVMGKAQGTGDGGNTPIR